MTNSNGIAILNMLRLGHCELSVLLSMPRNFFHQVICRKWIEELLSHISVIAARFVVVVVNPNLILSKKIQNRAARITTNSPYDASAGPLLQNLGWTSIKDLIKKETATLTYKVFNSLPPQYLGKLFSKCSNGSDRNLHSTETTVKYTRSTNYASLKR